MLASLLHNNNGNTSPLLVQSLQRRKDSSWRSFWSSDLSSSFIASFHEFKSPRDPYSSRSNSNSPGPRCHHDRCSLIYFTHPILNEAITRKTLHIMRCKSKPSSTQCSDDLCWKLSV